MTKTGFSSWVSLNQYLSGSIYNLCYPVTHYCDKNISLQQGGCGLVVKLQCLSWHSIPFPLLLIKENMSEVQGCTGEYNSIPPQIYIRPFLMSLDFPQVLWS